MNILIIGRGAREHAITWKIARSEQIEKIFCATGNSGVVDLAETVEIRAEDVKKLLAFAKKNNVSHVIPGPEVSYTEGIVELFSKAGIHVFGPGRHSFDLEISKAFAKELMCKHDIPTASFGVFSDQDSAFQYLQENSPPFIIKADGIDAGKGLIIARDEITARLAVNVILKDKIFGEAGKKIVIEELIPGQPVSVVAFTDGERILGATTVVIYQRAYDQDRGPFTGGMGAFSPDPRVDDKLLTQLKEDFLLPTIRGMAEENRPLKGIIYMNLILTDSGPRVVDFQTRFNDPATQVVLPRMKTDLIDVMTAIAEGRGSELNIEWDDRYSVSVVMVSGGYPMRHTTNHQITGTENVTKSDDVLLFHARTALSANRLITTGGRVLNVVALDETLEGARNKVYSEVEKIHFNDVHYRRDIAENFITEGEGI